MNTGKELREKVERYIDEAIKELDDGKGTSHEKVKEMYPQWFRK